MDQLRDIQGLQPISWWPLAPGWWAVIFVICCVFAFAMYLLYAKYKYYRSWRGKAFRKLSQLEDNLATENLKTTLQELSAEIRLIAMQTASRNSCAGLAAHNWLQWLQAHDPRGFVWTNKGTLLIADQYAPEQAYEIDQVREIISAIRAWVHK